MKKITNNQVYQALSKISGMPVAKIDGGTSLLTLAKKADLTVNGLLEKLCMELRTPISNHMFPMVVSDIMVGPEKTPWPQMRGV